MERIREFRQERVLVPRGFAGFELPALPLDVEIGCGSGLHPILRARAHPDRFVVAIERTRNRFESFSRRLEREPRPANLLPVHADGIAWASHALPPASVDRWFFLYPNPYPRPRDRGKRWYAHPFFHFVKRALKPGGVVTFRTNLRFYFEDARATLREKWGFEEVSAGELRGGREGEALTHFERKYLARGETCYALEMSLPGRG